MMGTLILYVRNEEKPLSVKVLLPFKKKSDYYHHEIFIKNMFIINHRVFLEYILSVC